MDSSEREARRGSFGAAADIYERGRPSYPADAVEWLVPAAARKVVDLGAGTGKLTRLIHERGWDVVAVEPSEGMREQFARAVPGVPALAGSGEDIPLEDGSVDAVVVAQAWHWVDPELAVPEVGRVLTPGGQLGLVWNLRDEREDWVAELNRIVRYYGTPLDGQNGVEAIAAPFGPIERHTVEWQYHLNRSELVDLLTSRSYVIRLSDADRSVLLADIDTLLDTHPAVAGATEIVLPYVTECFRTRLPAS